jgi:hypothetical protein
METPLRGLPRCLVLQDKLYNFSAELKNVDTKLDKLGSQVDSKLDFLTKEVMSVKVCTTLLDRIMPVLPVQW